MLGGNYVALAISATALAISIYGVAERRRDARRMERLRLIAIISDLDALYFEQLKTPDGLSSGDFTSGINSRREVLKVYAKCIDGQDESARRRIETALNVASED